MNGFCKKLINSSLLALLILSGISCSSYLNKNKILEPEGSPEMYRMIQREMADARLEIKGSVTIESLNLSGSGAMEITFTTLDSLNILLRDPLGRKAVQFKMNGDEYLLRMLRKREKYSGTELPAPYRDLPVARLSFTEIRRLLLGIPLCDIVNYPVAGCLTENGLNVRYSFAKNNLPDQAILTLAGGDPIAQIQYHSFVESGGLIFPENLTVRSSAEDFSLDIHLTSYKIQTKDNELE